MKKSWKSITALTLSFLAGIILTVIALKAQPDFAARLLGAPPPPRDPFSFLAEEQKKLMGSQNPLGEDDFFTFPSLGQVQGGEDTVQEIKEREDKDFYYIDVKMSGLDGSSVKAKAEEGYVTITGEVEKQSGEGNGNNQSSFFHSSFSRSFPLPPNVDANKMQMISGQDNTLTLKFPKGKGK